MAKKLDPPKKSGGLPLWLGTFGDLMSLLLTFFILLLSMATFDSSKLVEAEASMQGALTFLQGGIKMEPSSNRITLPGDITIPPEYAEEVRMIEQSIIDFNEMPNLSLGEASIMGDGVNGFIITLPTNAVFDEHYNINENMQLFLRRVAQIFSRMPENTHIEILGKSNRASTAINFERASNAALSIARMLHSLNIDGAKMSALGEEDKALKGDEVVNIRFYAKEIGLKETKGLLDR